MIDKHLESLENHWQNEIRNKTHDERMKIFEAIDCLGLHLYFDARDSEDVISLKDLYLKAILADCFEDFLERVKFFRHQYLKTLPNQGVPVFESKSSIFKNFVATTLFNELLKGYDHGGEIRLVNGKNHDFKNYPFNEELIHKNSSLFSAVEI